MNLPLTINIPLHLVEELKNDFYKINSFTKNEMEKIISIKDIDSVKAVVEFLKFDINNLVGDNFYKHSRAYFPHVDAPFNEAAKYLHVVVPIEKEYTENQFFIIFDQTSKIGPATWTGLLDVDIDFDHNKQIKGYIKEEDITNYSFGGITDLFHQTYLPYPKDWYTGLSGIAFEWIPGTAIIFPSNRLHCSGTMPKDAKKLGITLKFKMNNNVY
jgi:hypothetical protein